eukprot:scaffold154321_cov33-Tisochrysis_lutea.AAC.5
MQDAEAATCNLRFLPTYSLRGDRRSAPQRAPGEAGRGVPRGIVDSVHAPKPKKVLHRSSGGKKL